MGPPRDGGVVVAGGVALERLGSFPGPVDAAGAAGAPKAHSIVGACVGAAWALPLRSGGGGGGGEVPAAAADDGSAGATRLEAPGPVVQVVGAGAGGIFVFACATGVVAGVAAGRDGAALCRDPGAGARGGARGEAARRITRSLAVTAATTRHARALAGEAEAHAARIAGLARAAALAAGGGAAAPAVAPAGEQAGCAGWQRVGVSEARVVLPGAAAEGRSRAVVALRIERFAGSGAGAGRAGS